MKGQETRGFQSEVKQLLHLMIHSLYSNKEIFLRELISNASDAADKLRFRALSQPDLYEGDGELRVRVSFDKDNRTLTIADNGIGMNREEVIDHLGTIAKSGTKAFLESMGSDQAKDSQLIGQFGVGFYSAFIVADKVTVRTRAAGEKPENGVFWESAGEGEYTVADITKEDRGTEITLHLNEESLEFANEYRAREVIEKYCSFMPVEIYLSKANAPQEYETIDEADLREDDVVVEHIHEDAKTEEKENENGEKEVVEVSPAKDQVKINKRPVSLSDTQPLWMKHPNECTEEEYKEFYRKVFMDYKEPLFWIHLNMDYPFNLKGILYFPKINTEYESIEGTIKLYNNQVFIADNIKEVIPEFLMLLKGCIDCPDLPLNVSRSALQNDGFVKKISEYISKKVADKLSGMCKTDRETYEKYWDDINPFIKFGCLKDTKFSDRMMDYILYKNLDGKYLTLEDYLKENETEEEAKEESETVIEENKEETAEEIKKDAEEGKEPEKTTVYYVTDEVQQSQYINMFKEEGQDALILKHNIDSAFISHVEQKKETVKFMRIDADINESVKADGEENLEEQTKELGEIFKKALGKENLTVKAEKLKNESVSSMMTVTEESRRMQEMMKMYNMYGMDSSMFGGQETLVLNLNNKLVQYVLANKEGDLTKLVCEQLYDLAVITHRQLTPEEMTKFVARSNEILKLLAK